MLFKNKPEDKILILGHRGSPLKEIENTLPSFLRAIEDGADGVELDIRPTVDHKLVISHDNQMKRVFGSDKKIEECTLAEIREVAPTVPELREVFDALGPVWYDIEIKADSPLDYNREVVTLLVEELDKRKEFWDKIVLSSFNPMALRQAAKATKNRFPMAPIYDCSPTSHLPKMLQHGAGRFFCKTSFLKPKYDIAAREKKTKPRLPVVPWTVDTDDALEEMIALKCPAIITNNPEKVVKILEERGLR